MAQRKMFKKCKSATFQLDGATYKIVASPGSAVPICDDKLLASAEFSEGKETRDQLQLTDYKVFRRPNYKMKSSSFSNCSRTDSVDFLDTEDMQPDSSTSVEVAMKRLRQILRVFDGGLEVPSDKLKLNLQYAISVFEHVITSDSVNKKITEEEDDLSEVQQDSVPPEVRAWLASTFTRQNSACSRKVGFEKPKFRSVANAIRAGIFVERIYRRMSSSSLAQFPPDVTKILKQVDDWSFDVFQFNEAAGGSPIRYLGVDLLNRYGLNTKFKIQQNAADAFFAQMESGYNKHKNLYHNSIHATDVTQTMHYMISQTELSNLLTDLEIFAAIFAAIIHDYEHTGTTNGFHVMAQTEVALMYNDRAVLENHHISAAFRLLREEENNICSNLTKEEFREFRNLVIEMVLATDMSCHFQQVKAAKSALGSIDQSLDKSKVLSLVLHSCDISHPSKPWDMHVKWTESLLEEFFRQGDKEKELGLPFSPLCDRNTTLIAESQIGFIDFIVEPTLIVLEDTLHLICEKARTLATDSGPAPKQDNSVEATKSPFKKPWREHLSSNKQTWKARSEKDAFDRLHRLETLESKSEDTVSQAESTVEES
ncbi:dual specificity calcium/calmodulin-dependent 3',5'-cyclic nucleotide phosphodiesterase 1-like isoform X2 [Artemia franciscana]|uniref:dual specificity calcium/calmodulin-dependent 3',5'-cyclic nucleotide phosphodiesterase 1-like isoform X2 n=1 Tax=Artemia franciscana TaxID=6661 RepID=UPI0032DBA404